MDIKIDYKALSVDPDILTKAWNGDAISQLLLGKAYFSAVYTKDNCINAFKWIHRSAEQGNMEAQLRLADLFALGQGTSKSDTDAYKWYTKSALQGYKKALIRIHNLYQQDKKMHCRGELNSAESTDRCLQRNNNIRELYEYRLRKNESILNHTIDYYTEQFNMLTSGNQGDPNVLLQLGFLYQHGYGVKKCIILAIRLYTEAAKLGNRDAQYHLGYLYENDTDIKFNYYFALRWYRASAARGNIAAQNALGYFYEKGLATELNHEGAIYWYTKAAKSGHSDAQLTLGKIYRKGEYVEQELSQVIKWYTLAASQGNGVAQNCLNQLHQHGKTSLFSGVETGIGYVGEQQIKPTLRSKLQDDIEKLNSLPHIKQLKKLAGHALRTDGNAMYAIGMKYYHGQDFTQNKDIGFQWIKKAGKAGLEEAELKLAEMYKNGGDVVDQDYHESSIWTTKVVLKKSSEAQCNLGLLYLSGEGVREDPLEASKWFTKSADQGNTEGYYQFGLLRLYGSGVRKDEEEAIEWLYKSASSGNTNALHLLGEFYENGEYIDKVVCRAIKLYEYSANNGNTKSQIVLAEIYEQGDLVDQNQPKAEKYYQLAKDSLNSYQVYGLAIKYFNGVFGNSNYVKALELFKRIADEDPSSDCNIFQTPISERYHSMDFTKLVDMLISASERGEEGICYNIGYLFESGASSFGEILFDPSYTDAIHWYSIAATNGDSRAKYKLGVIYEEGKDVEVDLTVAYNYYSDAYENGNSDAAYKLALMYLNEKYVTQDLIKAYCLFTEASSKGHKEAFTKLIPSEISDNLKMLEAVANAGYVAVQYQLGVFYQNQRKSGEKAIEWLTLAAKGGVTDAHYRLGWIYDKLRRTDQSYPKAVCFYSAAVKKDHDDAMYQLARIYHLGRGVKRDYQKAYDLYIRASEFGHSESIRILNITNLSAEDFYIENDEATSDRHSGELMNTLSMIKIVAEKGNIDLQYKLGIFYMTNKRHLNYKEALQWLQMASSNGNTDAIYQLGLLYENGQGTIKNYNAAYQLYSQAKEKGHGDAIYRLGIAYQYGLGVAIDTFEAVSCYTHSAELGSSESQYTLGKLYDSGELVEKNALKALEWYTRAYLNGNLDVIKDLYHLYDENPLDSYFYKKLFRIISNIERTFKSDDYDYYPFYGSAYVKLGTMYFHGQGITINHTKALTYFLKAYYDYQYKTAEIFLSLEYDPYELSAQSIYLAKLKAYSEIQEQIPNDLQYELGMVYYNGVQDISINYTISSNTAIITVLGRDFSIAYRYFKLSSENGYPRAQNQIGLMYLRGHGVEKDHQKALKCFTTASEQMDTWECLNPGLDFHYGRKVDKNHEIAEIYLQRAAEENEEEAQTYLDAIHLDKIEKEHNSSKRMEQLEKTVEDMNPISLYDRGMKLYTGSCEGVKNYSLSFFYIRKAAEKNHSQAIAQLGIIYLDGKAVEKDENEGIKWIEKSIELMDPYECYEQGIKFYNDKDYRISLLYIKRAADGSDSDARSHLGLVYLQGLGVEKNHEQAMEWFEQSTMNLHIFDCMRKRMQFYNMVEVNSNFEVALLYLRKALLYLRKAAEENDEDAQSQLGIMYLQGFGVEKNYDIAVEWIVLSIKIMDKYGCYRYGMKFCFGIEVEKDYTIGLLYLQKAADESYGPAQAQIGLMYLDGHGVSKNKSEGMKWINKSVKNMDIDECYDFGIRLYCHINSGERFGLAFIFIKEAAERGYGLAQAFLGEMYHEGKGVQRNQDEALEWIRKSTRTMDPSECYQHGMKCYSGTGVEKNYSIALLYLRAAYIKKYTPALIQIGRMYLYGHGVEKNKEKSMECFQQSIEEMDPDDYYHQGMTFYNEYHHDISLLYIRKAVEAGCVLAQSQLGMMLLEGKFIQKNQAVAMEWIVKSMKLMAPNDCYSQGMALYSGTTVIQDYDISFCFIKKAAENHHGLAQAHLGLVYLQGLGVEKNKNEALKWFEQSIKELSPDECYQQGVKFYNGTEVDQNCEVVLLYLQKAAASHHGPSQTQLALMYLEGSGVEKNHDIAMDLIEKSMNEMKLEECYRQGMLFYHKTELENNYDIALHYLNRASKANAYAQAQLGHMYLKGVGVAQNYEEAVRWHKRAENNSIGDSRYCLSKICHYDQGGMQDFVKAFELYQEELEMQQYIDDKPPKTPHALRGIGLLYEYGDGSVQNYKKALEYYKRSAQEENMTAYYNIGLLYYYGKGVDRNYKEALLWFAKAAHSSPDSNELHVFLEDNDDVTEDITESPKRAYSLQPETVIYGAAHYYIGLLYNNGYGVDQDKGKAGNYFKMAHIYGVKRAKKALFK
ncbi:HCP-like protein [Backusella circina FSU 941]|nr:HCP-like protein [Backusella circina FSU 941]